MIVAFEGVNGAGKSTVIQCVAKALRDRSIPVAILANPGAHPVALKLREILKSPDMPMDVETQLLLFTAARRLLWQEVEKTRAELGENAVVLLDRWLWSTLVYQGHGASETAVLDLHQQFVTDCPVHGILLDVPAEVAMERVRKATGQDVAIDRFEKGGLEALRKLVDAYRGYCPAARRIRGGHDWCGMTPVNACVPLHDVVQNCVFLITSIHPSSSPAL